MPNDLSDYEAGTAFDGDYGDTLAELQKRLAHIQVAHIVHRRRAIVVLEGWDASGKGGAIQRLTAEWDPRWFQVHPIGAPRSEVRTGQLKAELRVRHGQSGKLTAYQLTESGCRLTPGRTDLSRE